ncbi:hypothetical protein Aple_100950 [Acrocarpospora pleiomorpha]|uniref:Mini-circle protein n=1 Tax=Acrocarpospora pleiomorpha TaxID=90975 RepID=A0A5M3Y1V5_9ACTN|nr:DinB family protein [Acrocarpospora pleiomorpha]GES27196.1 hypothetical protein Aple_100950 [Acrocarpospora pleiomorpha]
MRIDPPLVADEREMLLAWLDYHRETLAVKCDGLTEEQLRDRAAEPSTLSLLGLVRHMADVERSWFRRVLEDEDAPPLHFTETDPDGDFDNVDDASARDAFAAWRAEIEVARANVARWPDLGAVGKRQRHGEYYSLRWILVHMIEEYARHNGHADIIRQRVDGATGE